MPLFREETLGFCAITLQKVLPHICFEKHPPWPKGHGAIDIVSQQKY